MKRARLCINDFVIGNMIFLSGTEYEIEYNPADRNLYLYHCHGYATVTKGFINEHFL